jgi:hypothetical protein
MQIISMLMIISNCFAASQHCLIRMTVAHAHEGWTIAILVSFGSFATVVAPNLALPRAGRAMTNHTGDPPAPGKRLQSSDNRDHMFALGSGRRVGKIADAKAAPPFEHVVGVASFAVNMERLDAHLIHKDRRFSAAVEVFQRDLLSGLADQARTKVSTA